MSARSIRGSLATLFVVAMILSAAGAAAGATLAATSGDQLQARDRQYDTDPQRDQAPDGTRDQIGQGVDIVAQTEAQAGALAGAGSQTQTQTETQAAIQAQARTGRP